MKKTYFFYFIFLVITSYLLLAIAYYFGYSSLISDSIFPGFNDLRVVAESCDCYRMGYNPHIVKNEYCKWIFNYPLIWLDILKFLGLSGKNIYLTGFIMLGAFLISSLKLFNNLEGTNIDESDGHWLSTSGEAVWYSLAQYQPVHRLLG